MHADEARLVPTTFSALPGWNAAGHSLAFASFRRSAGEMLSAGRGFSRATRFAGSIQHWQKVCLAALAEDAEPRQFFETHFRPFQVDDPIRPEGLVTGYYEAEAHGSLDPSPEYPIPIYAKPPELVTFPEPMPDGRRYGQMVDGVPAPFPTRVEIEEGGVLSGRGLEIVWLSDWADAFFIHIQGSGRVHLADGSILRLAYAGKNGEPYGSIAKELIERGLISAQDMSMQALRQWIAANPDEGLKLMRRNRSYIFFRKAPIEDPALGPPGAEQVQLTPRHSIAVDRAYWAFGTPMFLETKVPRPDGMAPFRELLIAQDTGSAIKGAARCDVFWGAGAEAAHIAGHLKSPARFIVLLPKGLVL